ncbi:MAG: hypothetical protein M3T56_18330 [Chloroflexota bacterium]|nr:hypothetical protein [Chloroflexota bacterium]
MDREQEPAGRPPGPADWHTLDLAIFILRALDETTRGQVLEAIENANERGELIKGLRELPEADPDSARERVNYRVGLPVFGNGRLLEEYGVPLGWSDDDYVFGYASVVRHFMPESFRHAV